jgi:ribonucleotide reductase alpha subunit
LLSEADKGRIVPGFSFQAETYTADSGKQYVNKILTGVKETVIQKSVVTNTPAVAVKKAFVPKAKVEEISKGLSKEEWKSKDERISRQGLIQASLIALAPVVSIEILFQEAKKLADQGLQYVNEK